MKRYSKEIYKIFYLVFRLYMYQANTKNCNYNAYGLKINKKTNVSALKFYYNFYYLVYLLKDVGYVKFLINNMVSKYFILSDPRIYYILYLKKKSIMYNKSIVNSKLFYKVTNLKIYFYNDFVLRADMSIFVKNTMYVEYLRLFKYNEYLTNHPLLIRYQKIKGVLEGFTGKFFLFDNLKERYKGNLFLNRYHIYKLKRKLVPDSFIKHAGTSKSVDIDFKLAKLLILFKDRKLIKLFWSFFKRKFKIYSYHLIFKEFYANKYQKVLRNWETFSIVHIFRVYRIQKKQMKNMVLKNFYTLFNKYLLNSFMYKKNIVLDEISDILLTHWVWDISYWYRIINFSLIDSIDNKYLSMINEWENMSCNIYTLRRKKKKGFKPWLYFCSLWYCFIKFKCFSVMKSIDNVTMYNNEDLLLRHLTTQKDNLDYITYQIWSHLSVKRDNYNIEVVLKLAYKDRYLLDKKKYYERYFLSLCISLLSEEPDFMIKSFVLFLNFEFYYKLSSLKLLTTTNIKSNNYIMDKSLRFDYYKRFIVSDFTYNSSVNYSIYFKNNQVFYLEYCRKHFETKVKPDVDYWCDWQIRAEADAFEEMEAIRNLKKTNKEAKEREKLARKERTRKIREGIIRYNLEADERRIEKARLRELKKQEADERRKEKARLRELKKQEADERRKEKAKKKAENLGVCKIKLTKEERKIKIIKRLLFKIEENRDYELNILEVKETQYRLLNLTNILKSHLLEKEDKIAFINDTCAQEKKKIYIKYNITEKDLV